MSTGRNSSYSSPLHRRIVRVSEMGGASKPRDGQNPFLKSMATGTAVVMEMLSGGLFFENVKMEKQRTSAPYPQICSRLLKQGLSGFWAGFWISPTGFRRVCSAAGRP